MLKDTFGNAEMSAVVRLLDALHMLKNNNHQTAILKFLEVILPELPDDMDVSKMQENQ